MGFLIKSYLIIHSQTIIFYQISVINLYLCIISISLVLTLNMYLVYIVYFITNIDDKYLQ